MASKFNINAIAEDIIKQLNLSPDVEGGFCRRTYTSGQDSDGQLQVRSTAIYYLVTKSKELAWHKLHGLEEIQHFYAGDPVEVRTATPEGVRLEARVCGPDVFKEQQPQLVIPANHWQSARCLGEWTLFGCTVTPGFESEKRELAPEGWQPLEPAE